MSIYHLHIPRTSGIYVKNNVLPHLISGGVEHFISNRTEIKVDKIKSSKFVGGHFGLMPLDYMDNPDVFCLLRDPVERFISNFKYIASMTFNIKDANEELENWLYGEQADIQSNVQSKFLTGKMNLSKFNQSPTIFINSSKNNWFIEDYNLDLNVIEDNLNKFNFYTMENYNMFKKDLNYKLTKNFNFTTFKNNDKANSSLDINIKFNKKHIDKIKELNYLDIEVYNYVREIEKRY